MFFSFMFTYMPALIMDAYNKVWTKWIPTVCAYLYVYVYVCMYGCVHWYFYESAFRPNSTRQTGPLE